jgi:hypothetical protein
MDTWKQFETFKLDSLKDDVYDLYMVRYHHWTSQCVTDGVLASGAAEDIDQADSVDTATMWYQWLLLAQFLLILASITTIFMKKQHACSRSLSRKTHLVRFIISSCCAIGVFVALSVIDNTVNDKEMIYLATNNCTEDLSLEWSFEEISTFVSKAGTRWTISLIFLILVFGIDIC